MGRPALRVMLSSAGRRVELLRLFGACRAARVRVLAADAVPTMSPACQVADAAFAVPPVSSDEFVEAMQALCRSEDVDLLIPTIDPELAVLAHGASGFDPTAVVVSRPDTVALATDKLLTARRLDEAGLPVPVTVALPTRSWSGRLPIVLKPAQGSASVGLRIVPDARELANVSLAGYVAQEALPGSECTVNCYVSRQGELLAAVPHRRLAVRCGEVSTGEVIHHQELERAAVVVAQSFTGFQGPFCFQAFIEGERLLGVIEVNARFGGGYPLSHAAGADFVTLLVRERLGLPVEPLAWSPGFRMLRFDQSLFIGP